MKKISIILSLVLVIGIVSTLAYAVKTDIEHDPSSIEGSIVRKENDNLEGYNRQEEDTFKEDKILEKNKLENNKLKEEKEENIQGYREEEAWERELIKSKLEAGHINQEKARIWSERLDYIKEHHRNHGYYGHHSCGYGHRRGMKGHYYWD